VSGRKESPFGLFLDPALSGSGVRLGLESFLFTVQAWVLKALLSGFETGLRVLRVFLKHFLSFHHQFGGGFFPDFPNFVTS